MTPRCWAQSRLKVSQVPTGGVGRSVASVSRIASSGAREET